MCFFLGDKLYVMRRRKKPINPRKFISPCAASFSFVRHLTTQPHTSRVQCQQNAQSTTFLGRTTRTTPYYNLYNFLLKWFINYNYIIHLTLNVPQPNRLEMQRNVLGEISAQVDLI